MPQFQISKIENAAIDMKDFTLIELARRLVFNALIGNADMHLKNWSLVYPDRRQATLAPGYDLVSTIAFLPDTNMALTLGRSEAMTELSLDQLSYLAAKARLPRKLVLDAGEEIVSRFLNVWRDGQAIESASAKAIRPIKKLLGRIPLVMEAAKGK